mmetsp:Transcript_5929/g.18244  ORF Transcript_5929/g.18244 Transcript_5929/m.18244 type:complete len:122 (+) Transcript_5929:50-415(+)
MREMFEDSAPYLPALDDTSASGGYTLERWLRAQSTPMKRSHYTSGGRGEAEGRRRCSWAAMLCTPKRRLCINPTWREKSTLGQAAFVSVPILPSSPTRMQHAWNRLDPPVKQHLAVGRPQY